MSIQHTRLRCATLSRHPACPYRQPLLLASLYERELVDVLEPNFFEHHLTNPGAILRMHRLRHIFIQVDLEALVNKPIALGIPIALRQR